MIEALPCGCKTIPLERESQIKEMMLAGNIVWFDDPRCMEHEGGSGMMGFFIYHEGIVYGRLWIVEDEMKAEFSLNKAIDQMSKFYKGGFDFSYGRADLEKNKDGGYTLVCAG